MSTNSAIIWVDVAFQALSLINTILRRLETDGHGASAERIRNNMRMLGDMKPVDPLACEDCRDEGCDDC